MRQMNIELVRDEENDKTKITENLNFLNNDKNNFQLTLK